MKYIKDLFKTKDYSKPLDICANDVKCKLKIKNSIYPETKYTFNEIAAFHRREIMKMAYGEKQTML